MGKSALDIIEGRFAILGLNMIYLIRIFEKTDKRIIDMSIPIRRSMILS